MRSFEKVEDVVNHWKRLVAACTLSFPLVLGACLLGSDDEVFDLKAGVEIPYETGEYKFSCENRTVDDGVPKVDTRDTVIRLEKLGDNTNRYFYAEDHFGSLVSFFRVKDDVYVAAYPNRPGTTGQIFDIVRINLTSISFLEYSEDTLRKVAAATDVVASEKKISGEASAEKAFLITLALEAPDPKLGRDCTRTN